MEASLLNLLGAGAPLTKPTTGLWHSVAPTLNQELGVIIETSGDDPVVQWGDGAVETVVPGDIVSHMYDGTPLTEGIDILNRGHITEFYSSVGSHVFGEFPIAKFGGVFDARAIPYAQTIHVEYHDLDEFILSQNVITVSIAANKLTGLVTDYLTPNIEWLDLQQNLLSGPIPDLSGYTQLRALGTTSNTNIGGGFPILPPQIHTADFANCGLVGDLSLLGQYSYLNRCWVYDSPGLNIPINWDAPLSLTDFRVFNCQFSATETDTVLIAMEALGTNDGIIDIRGNDAPTATGVTAKNLLIGRGWTVQTQ